ncbi:MAG: amidophosphoribosyltransferase [Balneolales bacterium]|nr:amidophosphoribosyltransferase [Balneolales bacterium]
MSDKPKHYCGIFGIFNHSEASLMTYYGLHALQHRGQESAGIVSSFYDETRGFNVMPIYKGFGLVLSVFDDKKVFTDKLKGKSAIGHNRYSTSGSSTNPANIQPFRVHYKNGNLALAHNGNLTNASALRKRFRDKGVLFQSTSDTELILHLISHSKKSEQLEQIMDALSQIEGAYCLVIQTDTQLIAVRDPNGFRPLCLGKLDGAFVVASESCALDIIGADYIRDIKPGEVVIIDDSAVMAGEPASLFLNPKDNTKSAACVFEYIYFSRPDSKIFGENVDKVRRKIGKYLAKEHPVSAVVPPSSKRSKKKPIVISVPDSSNTAALGYAGESHKNGEECKFEIGLIRNHYVGRTFISPGQESRQIKVRTKFNPVRGVIEGRDVIIVDDSIVRGTTSRMLIELIRKCNPKSVHFLVSSPPIIEPCFYGMDFPSPEELIANKYKRNVEDIAKALGVDSLHYLSPEGLIAAVKEANPTGQDYCSACFTGNYPVKIEQQQEKEANELV